VLLEAVVAEAEVQPILGPTLVDILVAMVVTVLFLLLLELLQLMPEVAVALLILQAQQVQVEQVVVAMDQLAQGRQEQQILAVAVAVLSVVAGLIQAALAALVLSFSDTQSLYPQ